MNMKNKQQMIGKQLSLDFNFSPERTELKKSSDLDSSATGSNVLVFPKQLDQITRFRQRIREDLILYHVIAD